MITKNFREYLAELGLREYYHVVVHSSFKKIMSAFPELSVNEVIRTLQETVTEKGSVIFPTFTYCFAVKSEDSDLYNKETSPSQVGLLSEIFRKQPNVDRTSSPTHSFAIWGEAKNFINEFDSPSSPLGRESIFEWLTKKENSFVLMIGTGFNSLSYMHYLETAASVPYINLSPWDYLNILPAGLTIHGEQKLVEIPGCSESFGEFENYLLEKQIIQPYLYNELSTYLISTTTLYEHGIEYLKTDWKNLLCKQTTCAACDSRRGKLKQLNILV